MRQEWPHNQNASSDGEQPLRNPEIELKSRSWDFRDLLHQTKQRFQSFFPKIPENLPKHPKIKMLDY